MPPTSSPWSRSPSSAGRRSTAGRSPRRSPTPASPATRCGGVLPDQMVLDMAPYVWSTAPSPDQFLGMLNAWTTAGEELDGVDIDVANFAGRRPAGPGAQGRRDPLRAGPAAVRRDLRRGRGPLRRGRLHRVVHPRPAQHAGQGHRGHRPLQVRGRQHDRVPRRPVHARVPHPCRHGPGLLPRVDLHGHGAHRHQRPRPLVGPGADGARLRDLAAGGADLAGPAGGDDDLPLVLRRGHVAARPQPVRAASPRRRPGWWPASTWPGPT